MRTKLLAVVATACLLVGGLTVASAAQLSVTGGSISTAEAGPCPGNTLTVTRTDPDYFLWFLLGYEGIRLSGDLESCRGRDVTVRGTTGTPAVSGVVPATGSTTLSWSTARYATNRTFIVTVDGWQVPATTVNP